MTIATAFLGYVLPWGQMSFWGASVIIGLLSAIPYVGSSVAIWLWRGFSVRDGTLARFLALHFLLPFVLVALVILHIIFLHDKGSSNPLLRTNLREKTYFLHIFSHKDLLGVITALSLLSLIAFIYSDILGDVENFIVADRGTTPLHIIPEWYYLFAYAILRAIPRKLGGVIALVFRIAILYTLPLVKTQVKPSSAPYKKKLFWCLVAIFGVLTWIGARPVEDPYIIVGASLTLLYFTTFWFFIS